MTKQEAIRHLQAARLMLLRPDGQPISDLYDALSIAIEALEQPTVDAVQVVHGEWIELPDKADHKYSHTCSACHRFHITEGEAEFYHYCPNCGARMDGKEQIDG